MVEDEVFDDEEAFWLLYNFDKFIWAAAGCAAAEAKEFIWVVGIIKGLVWEDEVVELLDELESLEEWLEEDEEDCSLKGML